MRPARILADFKIVVRSYLRNPVALFFSLIFPIILISLFGLIFSAVGNSPVSVQVLNLDHNSPGSVAFLAALNDTSVVKVQVVNWNESNFATLLGQNDDPVGIVIPAGFNSSFTTHTAVNLTVYVDPEDASSSGTVVGAVQGVASAFNLHLANGTAVVGYTTKNVGSQVFTYIDYLIPGLIGFSILTSPMFSLVDVAVGLPQGRDLP